MDRSTLIVVLTTLVGTAVLSGCTAAAHPQGSAMAVEPPADQAASEWAADAELVTIVGMEGVWHGSTSYGMEWNSESGSAQGHSMSASARSDPDVGDGSCAIWVFRYVSDDKGLALDVVVSGNGTVLHQEEDQRDEDDVPLGPYQVNSDEAVRTARRHSDGFDQAVEDGGLLLVLDRDDDYEHPVWVLMAGDGGSGGFVIIDAVSGDVVFAMGDDWGSGYESYGTTWSG